MTALSALISIVSIFAIVCPIAAMPEQSAAAKSFQDSLWNRIGTEWYIKVKAHDGKLVLGTIHIRFRLSSDGTVRDLQVTSNTANRLMAELALESIKNTKLPPPPRNLLKNGTFQADIDFTLFPN